MRRRDELSTFNDEIITIVLILRKGGYNLSLNIDTRLSSYDHEKHKYVLQGFMIFSHIVDFEWKLLKR